MNRRPTLVVFLGELGDSAGERMVADARYAATFDALETALSTGAYGSAILITDEAPPPAAGTAPAGVEVIVDRSPFTFDGRLKEIVADRGMESMVYFGGGSVPLLEAEAFRQIATALAEPGIVTNNLYSADLVGVSPASAVLEIPQPFASDNPLPRLLRDATNLPVHALERTAATQFDIDSPADIRILAATGAGGHRLRAMLASVALDIDDLRRAMALFTDPTAEILVAGRVGSQVWRQIEQDSACRVRMLSEERGMQADGRLEEGRVRSILGFHLANVGDTRFFTDLAELGNVAFVDYRVIMAHFGELPGRADRFAADLRQPAAIAGPMLRRFVEAAMGAPTPVILGGHSLVAGGLLALIEAAWREQERPVI